MSDLADKIIGHYERHATAWDEDRARSTWNDKPWHDRFIAMLSKGASVIVNDEINRAYEQLRGVVYAERCRRPRLAPALRADARSRER